MPSRHRGFTLVELLVVIAVISILAAMLLPALEAARMQSLRIANANNLRTLAIVFTMEAEAKRDILPETANRNDYGAHFFWLDNGDLDLRPVVERQDATVSTVHTVVGAPAWDDPANTNTNNLAMSHSYFPGFRVAAASAPLRLAAAESRHCMWLDYLYMAPDGVTLLAVNVREYGQFDTYADRPCLRRYWADRAAVIGAFSAQYDCSVVWRPERDFEYVVYHPHGYLVGHVQP